MPIKILSTGAAIILDEEDFDLVEAASWHIYRIRPSLRPMVARIETRIGRLYRVCLHRVVAVRLDPSLVSRRFRVYPKNGDYLDCRRENLEIRMARKRAGGQRIEPRPFGWERTRYRHVRPKLELPSDPTWAGGITLRDIDRSRHGEGRRLRRCIHGVPID